MEQSKFAELRNSLKESQNILEAIIADKQYHKREILEPIIDSIAQIIQTVEEKLKK